MTKNKIAVIICIIALIIGLALGVYLPSKTNLKASQDNLNTLLLAPDKAVVSGEDGKLTVSADFDGSYVGNLKISGDLKSSAKTAEVAVSGSETADCKLEKLGDDYYITLNQNLNSVKVSFAANNPAGFTGVTFNPKNIIFDFSNIFIWGFGLMLIAGILVFFILLRDSYKSSSEVFSKYRHLVLNLITRDLKVKYRRSMLGFLWSILNPLLMALVINAVFQNLFRFDIEYFIVYYLTGSLIFNFMTEATTGSLTSVIGAASLIKKVYIPKYIFPLEKCLFAFVNMLFSSVAVIIVILIKRMPVHFSALLFFYPMICVLIFSLGLSLILASVNVFFRDVGHLYTVWTVAWMYLTPIIYPASILPNAINKIMQLNPMYYYVTYFRDVVMYGNIPDLKTHLICIIYAVLFLVIGLLTFKKKQDKFILYI